MGMFMFFLIMGRMLVLMGTMSGVAMAMHLDVSGRLAGVSPSAQEAPGFSYQWLVALGPGAGVNWPARYCSTACFTGPHTSTITWIPAALRV